ncbi:uncharacterized protein BXZ73DRAFT_101006 [Epithele typhae]|uniref:uncharacterized protein n=1 Tax=Epithele typhae TaxID=378194 RepID=UPI0020083B1A|nr:uncharacterized protein BXZ73DRAFT_101006 [Epithele typhae]KAH9933620.1 hypothetical protein BXZ73DRAFT_101006 [Epithele typhae]
MNHQHVSLLDSQSAVVFLESNFDPGVSASWGSVPPCQVNKWDPREKHCFVTGGSSGAGFALAKLPSARNERQSPGHVLKAYSFAVNSEAGSAAALEAAYAPFNGRAPDAVFPCARSSRPGFFIEFGEESLRQGLELTYHAQAFTALASYSFASWVQYGVLIACISGCDKVHVGYAAYVSGKFALRGLAETLHSEFKLYGIDVHIAFPYTIYSKGYEEENRVKPAVTLKIEETDSGNAPELVAATILSDTLRSETSAVCCLIFPVHHLMRK